MQQQLDVALKLNRDPQVFAHKSHPGDVGGENVSVVFWVDMFLVFVLALCTLLQLPRIYARLSNPSERRYGHFLCACAPSSRTHACSLTCYAARSRIPAKTPSHVNLLLVARLRDLADRARPRRCRRREGRALPAAKTRPRLGSPSPAARALPAHALHRADPFGWDAVLCVLLRGRALRRAVPDECLHEPAETGLCRGVSDTMGRRACVEEQYHQPAARDRVGPRMWSLLAGVG